jgi:helicase
VLIAPTWDRSVEHYIRGQFEPVLSGLQDPAALAEQILVEVQSGMARSRTQIARVFAQSLAAHQSRTLPLERTLGEMIDSGMLREQPAHENHSTGELRLAATPLGRIAVRHHLAPQTILQLTRFLEQHQPFTFLDVVVACACTGDVEPMLSVDFEELETLADSLAGQTSFLLANGTADLTQRFQVSGKRLLSALKTAAVLHRWTVMGDIEAVADDEGCYPFEITRLQESMDRLLLAVAGIQRLIDQPADSGDEPSEAKEPAPKTPNLRRIELWRQMILTGLEEEPAQMSFVSGIGPKWAQKLSDHGISSLATLASTRLDELLQLKGLSPKRAAEWIAEAAEIDQNPVPTLSAPRLRISPVEAECPVDPYRLRRALDLHCAVMHAHCWLVTGGLEPHRVEKAATAWSCDCPDFAKGHTCKHILKVRLTQGDPLLTKAVDRLHLQAPSDWLDLFSLWFDR